MSNAERQALWRKRRKAELDRLRETAQPKYGSGQPEPLRDAEREVAPEIEATLDDVKTEFADLVQEVGECLDDLKLGEGEQTEQDGCCQNPATPVAPDLHKIYLANADRRTEDGHPSQREGRQYPARKDIEDGDSLGEPVGVAVTGTTQPQPDTGSGRVSGGE